VPTWPTKRRSSTFVSLGFAALLVVGAAGCRGGGGSDGPDALDPETSTSAPPIVVVGDDTPTTITSAPTANPDATSAGDATDLDELDAALEAELDEVLDALDEYDQMTATTEGDPSQ
jgi:hypothetical protein